LSHCFLPTELPLIQAAALVTEIGDPLDHVAAQARERALPAVVGAAGAMQSLRDGDLVPVDADQVLVVGFCQLSAGRSGMPARRRDVAGRRDSRSHRWLRAAIRT
jgi:phosphoenolpyruvate-protein kinase (PTS system EI component)